MTAEPNAAVILRLGAHGDGIAETASGLCHIPFALPGERVRAVAGGLPELLSAPSPQRRRPQCRHFGICGGCLAQHMSDELYGAWKWGIVREAFRRRGLEPEIAPLKRVCSGSRRRAVLTARRKGGRIVLGYHRRQSPQLFALEECPVLNEAIVAGLAGLRAIASALDQREVRLTVLATAGGLDVAVADAGGPIGAKAAVALASLASRHAIARITRNGETVAERARPELLVGGVVVSPPPGLFVQAVAAAESAMVKEVLASVGDARWIADLFAGLGTFTLPLARRSRVLAVDGQARALAALGEAARRASGLKPIKTQLRDLAREPLSAKELAAFDAVVLDPPRAGAMAQALEIGRSRVACVAYASCNPATLARDARALVDAGFHLKRVVPIDQFLFSAHIEAVAVLGR